jgi:Ni/Co efflux regulator RcnB
MCDVRKLAVRLVLAGLAVGLLAGALAPANAQTTQTQKKKKRTQETHVHHETNATRLARIHQTIEDTYSHRYEVIGGGGYLRFRSGDYTKRNNEVTWATALNYYLNRKIAIVGDARGSFGDAHATLFNGYAQIPRPQINEYTFMGGASYRFYAKEKVAVSAQALAGVGWGIFSGGSKDIPGPLLGLWNDGIRPAFSLGVSADYNIYPNFAVRVTPTWVGTDFVGANGSSLQSNLGINAGVVYRFGRR